MKTTKNLASGEVIVARAKQGKSGWGGENGNYINICVVYDSMRNRFGCHVRHEWGSSGFEEWKDIEGHGNTAEKAISEIADDLFDSDFCDDDEFPHPYMRRQLLRDIREKCRTFEPKGEQQ